MRNGWRRRSGSVEWSAPQTPQNGPYYATPSWDQTLPAATRFVVLANFSNDAVLDRETGLVWSLSTFPDFIWVGAVRFCRNSRIGGRGGWRLPTLEELLSLTDSTGAIPPTFVVGPAVTWSATTDEIITTDAWIVTSFGSGSNGLQPLDKNQSAQAFCVRGGAGNTSPTN